MKKTLCLLALCFAAQNPALWAIPTEINYQGTLKEKGLPANGTKTITFQLTSQDGNTPYSNVISVAATVVNGLFSSKLNFQLLSGLTWETITPYIKVTVEGQVLSPTEKVSATAYANVSNTVVDGAISPVKVTSGYGLVPSGMISMFASDCPSGWTRYSALDNAFPMGGATYGVTGGSATHSHTISPDGAHNHGGLTGQGDTPQISDAGANFGNQAGWHHHSISTDGQHSHGGATGAASSLPPYVTVVWCQKN